MAIGGPPPNAQRPTKDGGKGAAGRYGFVAEVARGYLGTLWLARDPADSTAAGTVLVRHVAPIAASGTRAAILEAARWAQLGHAGEIVEGRTSVDLVGPLLDAEVLRSLLRTAALKHVGDPAVLLGLAKGVLREIAKIHERARNDKSPHGFGGVHPDSILLDTDGGIHLVEAGVGAAASAREPWRGDPQRIGYFAPEQTEARGVADARTDVFAVGIILWEALTGRRLFPGNDAKTARERVQKGAIARLDATRASAAAAIATPIADVVAKALEREPGARFQTAEDMADAVTALGPADASALGSWVKSLADAAIAKRRQLLERSSIPPADRASRPPPQAQVPGRRPSFSNFKAPTATQGAAPAPIPAAPRAPAPAPPPAPPRTAEAPPSTESAPPPPPSPRPSAPDARATVAAETPSNAPSTEPTSREAVPATEPDAPGGAPTTETPDAAAASTEPDPATAATEPHPAVQGDAAEAAGGAAPPPDAAAEDEDEIDVGDDGDEDTMVSAQTGALPDGPGDAPPPSAPPPPSSRAPSPDATSVPPTASKRPPALPASMPPSGAGPELLPQSGEPLAGPLSSSSPLAALTAPAAPRIPLRRIALIAGGVGVVGIAAGWLIGRVGQPKQTHSERSLAPVVILAPSGAPSAAAPGTPEVPVAASAEPAPSAATAEATAPSAPPAPSAVPEPEPVESPPAETTRSKPSSSEASKPRSSTTRSPSSSGYKPGGI